MHGDGTTGQRSQFSEKATDWTTEESCFVMYAEKIRNIQHL